METIAACAALCITSVIVAVVISRAASSVVRELSKQQVWLWNRLLGMIEPSLQERVREMLDAEDVAQQLEDDQDLSKIVNPPDPPTPFKY
jgi:hypothetical protein